MVSSALNSATQMLAAGVKALQLNLPSCTIEKLMEFALLIQKWNKTYNLTAIEDLPNIVTHHLLDSLAILPYIQNGSLLDVGAGAGLPGIPLALAKPLLKTYLLDSKIKKTNFLNHVVLSLKITNTIVVQSRIEDYMPQHYFDNIISRATMSASDIIAKTGRLCDKHGQLLVMQGKYPRDEFDNIKYQKEIFKIQVPFLNAERHLIRITGINHG